MKRVTTQTMTGKELSQLLHTITIDCIGNGGYSALLFNEEGKLEYGAGVPMYGFSKYILIIPEGSDTYSVSITTHTPDNSIPSYDEVMEDYYYEAYRKNEGDN